MFYFERFFEKEKKVGLNTKCRFHGNKHPDCLCDRHSVIKGGPAKVLIDEQGRTVDGDTAAQAMGIIPSVIFLRNDGWTLGARRGYVKKAYEQCRDEWIAFYRPYHDDDFQPIASVEIYELLS